MKLSILICTLNEPYSIDMLKRLRNILDPQIERYKHEVELLIHDAGRFMPTGTKRNELIKICEGDYLTFIDCDDVVCSHYINSIMTALESNPDVVTFNGWMTTNGGNRQDFTIKLGEKYEQRGNHYYRFPNHLCVFKKELIQHIKFPDIWVQEDYQWARQINDRKILKTSVHIDQDLYWYDFRSNKPRSPHGHAPAIR